MPTVADLGVSFAILVPAGADRGQSEAAGAKKGQFGRVLMHGNDRGRVYTPQAVQSRPLSM
ncbi:hypothetical protein DMR_36860 [Solidesulfovibrio magneticus RS-1]|uniref:Uncharacterized protein n=1 Tax=Solidesulfovibrio magneticus (strain ATCC 700980 / DSM 13731 / RS-1) TaxID=573370 RepID=C4XM49_SOLM1|nr:hypothetical protein DMR_36860 [Solidesulfovibrio magneticus RS-1]